MPFASRAYELGFHVMEDANLGTIKPSQDTDLAPIASGSSDAAARAAARSVTGVVGMLGGAPLFTVAVRQHLVVPEVHTSELHAAGTAVELPISHAGVLQEVGILQLRPTPIFSDSQSTIFVANSQQAVKRSVWTARRAAALRDSVDSKAVQFFKVASADNCADMLTRPVTCAEMRRLMSYIAPHTVGDGVDAWRSVPQSVIPSPPPSPPAADEPAPDALATLVPVPMAAHLCPVAPVAAAPATSSVLCSVLAQVGMVLSGVFDFADDVYESAP